MQDSRVPRIGSPYRCCHNACVSAQWAAITSVMVSSSATGNSAARGVQPCHVLFCSDATQQAVAIKHCSVLDNSVAAPVQRSAAASQAIPQPVMCSLLLLC